MVNKQSFNNIVKTSAAIIGISGSFQISAQSRPNIILIMTDQQTADAMSYRGNLNVKTPAMDALAADGVTFTRSYCSFPLSGPSRASIMTGKMPVEIKVTENGLALTENDISNSIGNRMSEAGYECLYAGKWHIPTADIPETGFGFRKVSGMNDTVLVKNVEKALLGKGDKPLFLIASFDNPHDICEYARSQNLNYYKVPIPENAKLPDLPHNFSSETKLSEGLMLHKMLSPKLYPTSNYTKKDWQKYLYTYYRLVEHVDKSIGELIALLKKQNLYNNSLIIFTSDHGDGVAAHKWNQKRALFEETINVPFIVKSPATGAQKNKSESNSLINIGLDIYPTICDFAGIATPNNLRGISIKRVLENEDANSHKSIFVETNLDGINLRGWCMIEGDYKYVRYQFFKDKEQLFNLKTDKGEKNNLVNNKSYASVLAQMQQKMRLHAQKTNDAILQKELK